MKVENINDADFLIAIKQIIDINIPLRMNLPFPSIK